MKVTRLILPVIALLAVVVLSAVFIVSETQKALVLQFGRIVSVHEEPGLRFKIPMIQEVVYYDDRILSLDLEPLEVTPLDDRRLIVDAFARYRITDVRRFHLAVRAGGERMAAERVDRIVRDELRGALGRVSSNDILSEARTELMDQVRAGASVKAAQLGLEIVDVRLKQTDLPPQNLNATYERMKADRGRVAADERARGREAAQRIMALADRNVIELVSDANRTSEIVRGEADARRNAIFAEVYGADPEFFEFYRSMNAYEAALSNGRSSMVAPPSSEFFDYLRASNPTGAVPQISPDAVEEARKGAEETAQQARSEAASAPLTVEAAQEAADAQIAPADGEAALQDPASTETPETVGQ